MARKHLMFQPFASPRTADAHVIIVWGPPCGGKNTYIEQHWTDGDLLIDYDDVMAAFCRQPDHKRVDQAHWIVFEAIQAAIGEVHAKGYAGTVWLPVANRIRVETICRIFPQASVVLVDPGRAVCEERALSRSIAARAQDGIATWYATESK